MKRAARIFIPLLALMGLTVCMVSPVGNFPLNDDWVYGKMVQRLATEGSLRIHPYAQAYALVQTLWALPFVKIFGFSFTVLRASTLILALLSAWGVALCGRELGFARRVALAAAAVVFCNPLFLNLSYTFMSDVPFLCGLVFSCLFLLKALRSGSTFHVFIGSGLAALSFFNRQFGVLIVVAFAFTAVLWWIRFRRGVGFGSVAALFGPWVIAGLIVLYLQATGQHIYTPPHALMRGFLDNLDPGHMAVLTISIALTLGLFLVPIGAGIAWRWLRDGRCRSVPQLATSAAVAALLVLGLLRDRRPLPRFPNILRDFGIGPILLKDTYSIWNPWSPVTAPRIVLWAITAMALLSAAVCIGAIVGTLFRRSPHPKMAAPLYCRRLQFGFLFLLGALLVLAPYNSRTVIYYDRYLLAAVPPFVLLAAGALPTRAPRGWFRPVAFACAALYVFSLVGLQDYMAWNHARWDAIAYLHTELGAKDYQIDGGYEFNGWYTSEEFLKRTKTTNAGNQGEKGWWVIHDRYKVTMTPQPTYEIVRRFPYFSWLGFETREILALERHKPNSSGNLSPERDDGM